MIGCLQSAEIDDCHSSCRFEGESRAGFSRLFREESFFGGSKAGAVLTYAAGDDRSGAPSAAAHYTPSQNDIYDLKHLKNSAFPHSREKRKKLEESRHDS